MTTYITTVTLYLEDATGEEIRMDYDCEVKDHGAAYCDGDGVSFGPRELELLTITDQDSRFVDKDSPLWKKIEEEIEIGLDATPAYWDDQIGEQF